jgi:hypothetical protein
VSAQVLEVLGVQRRGRGFRLRVRTRGGTTLSLFNDLHDEVPASGDVINGVVVQTGGPPRLAGFVVL